MPAGQNDALIWRLLRVNDGSVKTASSATPTRRGASPVPRPEARARATRARADPPPARPQRRAPTCPQCALRQRRPRRVAPPAPSEAGQQDEPEDERPDERPGIVEGEHPRRERSQSHPRRSRRKRSGTSAPTSVPVSVTSPYRIARNIAFAQTREEIGVVTRRQAAASWHSMSGRHECLDVPGEPCADTHGGQEQAGQRRELRDRVPEQVARDRSEQQLKTRPALETRAPSGRRRDVHGPLLAAEAPDHPPRTEPSRRPRPALAEHAEEHEEQEDPPTSSHRAVVLAAQPPPENDSRPRLP